MTSYFIYNGLISVLLSKNEEYTSLEKNNVQEMKPITLEWFGVGFFKQELPHLDKFENTLM